MKQPKQLAYGLATLAGSGFHPIDRFFYLRNFLFCHFAANRAGVNSDAMGFD